ncbi:MAG: hypothetical protein PVI23_05750 [Maricaulaceae bacterium]|jgi:hypothetical protein
MSLEDNGFFSPGKWGFMEGWPRGADAPVFDICHGEVHVARIHKEGGEWRFLLRQTPQMSTDLLSLLQMIDLVGKRMVAFEEQGHEQPVGSKLQGRNEAEENSRGSVLDQLLASALAAS